MLIIVALGVVIATVELSILYLRCVMSGAQTIMALPALALSILYLRCLPPRCDVGSAFLRHLSILYLRCGILGATVGGSTAREYFQFSI